MRYSPDGQWLASGDLDGCIQLWSHPSNSKTHSPNPEFKPLRGHTNWVRGIVFSPEGSTLVSSSDDETLRLWNVQDRHCMNILSEHTGATLAIAMSADGKLLISASQDRTVRLWQMPSGQSIKTLSGYTTYGKHSLSFSPIPLAASQKQNYSTPAGTEPATMSHLLASSSSQAGTIHLWQWQVDGAPLRLLP